MPYKKPGTIARERMEFDKRRLNPCPGRTDSERKRLANTLTDFRDELVYWLERTREEDGSYQILEWLPVSGVSRHAEQEWQMIRGHYETTMRGEANQIVALHEPNLRATNIIKCVSWYVNDYAETYAFIRPLTSPLPCPEWGRVPLTIKQWSIFVEAYAISRMYWSWIHTVRAISDDDTFMPAGFSGWHSVKTEDFRKRANGADKCQPISSGEIVTDHIVRKHLKLLDRATGDQ